MMKLGAVREPILPLKLAKDLMYEGQDCGSAGGMSASDVGISGDFVLLDIFDLKTKQMSIGCVRTSVHKEVHVTAWATNNGWSVN